MTLAKRLARLEAQRPHQSEPLRLDLPSDLCDRIAAAPSLQSLSDDDLRAIVAAYDAAGRT